MIPSTVEKYVIDTVRAMLFVSAETEIKSKHSFEELGGDSLDEVELLLAFESDCHVDFDDDEWYRIKTIGQAIKCIRGKLEKSASQRTAVPA